MSRVATYPSAINILRIIRMLLESYHGVLSFKDTISELGISKKTLSRYLSVIEYTFGDIIQIKRGDELGRSPGRDRYFVFKRYELESRTGYQLAPLYLSRFFMSFLEGTLLDESLNEAVGLFESAVVQQKSGNVTGDFGNKFYAVSVGPKSYSEHDETIEKLLLALVRQNPLNIAYCKPGGRETKSYTIRPLTMVMYKQGLYVIGDRDGWQRPHFFAVERINSCERYPDRTFDYPRDYSPAKLCEGSFGIFVDEQVDVKLKFSSDVSSEYITARRWHPSQVYEDCEDGSLILSMSVNGTQELLPWILGFGGKVEVLEPIGLRDEVCIELEAMNRTYS